MLLSAAGFIPAAAKNPQNLGRIHPRHPVARFCLIASRNQGQKAKIMSAQATIDDEAKVPAYTLPALLTLENGAPVIDPQTWFTQRRPEILEQFET